MAAGSLVVGCHIKSMGGHCTVLLGHREQGAVVGSSADHFYVGEVVTRTRSALPFSNGRQSWAEGRSDSHIKAESIHRRLSVMPISCSQWKVLKYPSADSELGKRQKRGVCPFFQNNLTSSRDTCNKQCLHDALIERQ